MYINGHLEWCPIIRVPLGQGDTEVDDATCFCGPVSAIAQSSPRRGGCPREPWVYDGWLVYCLVLAGNFVQNFRWVVSQQWTVACLICIHFRLWYVWMISGIRQGICQKFLQNSRNCATSIQMACLTLNWNRAPVLRDVFSADSIIENDIMNGMSFQFM